MSAVPAWLHVLGIVSLCTAVASTLTIAIDELSHPRHTWDMNVVWPVTALRAAPFAGVLTSYPVNWWLLRTGIKEVM